MTRQTETAPLDAVNHADIAVVWAAFPASFAALPTSLAASFVAVPAAWASAFALAYHVWTPPCDEQAPFLDFAVASVPS